MRTTLTIDEDIAVQIEHRRKRDGLSLKRVAKALLREGLRADPEMAAARLPALSARGATPPASDRRAPDLSSGANSLPDTDSPSSSSWTSSSQEVRCPPGSGQLPDRG